MEKPKAREFFKIEYPNTPAGKKTGTNALAITHTMPVSIGRYAKKMLITGTTW